MKSVSSVDFCVCPIQFSKISRYGPWKKAPEKRGEFDLEADETSTLDHIFGIRDLSAFGKSIERAIFRVGAVPSIEMVRPEGFAGNFVIDQQSTDDVVFATSCSF